MLRPRVLAIAAGHVVKTVPWVTLLAGCVTGTALIAVLAYFADHSRSPLTEDEARLAFLPVLAALAFVPRAPFRTVSHVTPLPAWLTPVGQIVMALPVLGLTTWAQLHLMAGTVPIGPADHPAATYPLVAQLAGWCAVTLAVAAGCDRSRYADLGGAVAAPISVAIVALAWLTPAIRRLLDSPPAGPHQATIVWSITTVAGLALGGAALRDPWHRYTRMFQRKAQRTATVPPTG